MSPETPLFTVPIPPCGDAHPGGSLACTAPRPGVYLLAFASPPDNRLTAPFCRALLAALDLLEFGPHPPGVLVTTSALPRFYSNGLDLAHAVETDGFWPLFYDVWRRFLTFPMPSLALLNGHAFAGGLMLALLHDYRLAPSPRGLLCLNELLFGAPLKPAMAALLRAKLPAPSSRRTLALEAPRLGAADAVALGLADGVAAAENKVDDALRFVEERGLADKAKTGVYGVIRAEVYRDLMVFVENPGRDGEETRFEEGMGKEDERREFGRVWYEQWAKENKPKL